jgi:Ca2+-transporting ATPase
MKERWLTQDLTKVAGTMRVRHAAYSSTLRRVDRASRRAWAILSHAGRTFSRIDGAQWAGAFAFNAFFSLIPLVVLLVTVASYFVDRDRAGNEVIAYLEGHLPMSGEIKAQIVDTFGGVVSAREGVGAIAFLMLMWAAVQCFITLILATNRAWNLEGYNWWRLPLKSLIVLGTTAGAIFAGLAVPALVRITKVWLLPTHDFGSWVYGLGGFLIPSFVVFFGLSLFYRLAPRRRTRFAEVWVAALCATILLRLGESLFVIYLTHFARLNAVYGAFGGIMASLLGIYVSGCIFIFGACLCAGWAPRAATGVRLHLGGQGNTP